ncbi:hypothetical protein BH23VER1_BH23VER1_04060 [soil metagenome]
MDRYYQNPDVRNRLVDYSGGSGGHHPTCAYLSQCDGTLYSPAALRPPSELDWFLEQGEEVARSLCDTDSLLVHFDMEYVNFDSPTYAFTEPHRAFEVQEPAVEAVEELLLSWGIRPLHLVTGQGHHFVWRIPLGSAVERSLRRLAPVSDWARHSHPGPHPQLPPPVPDHVVAAFSGLGLVMEYLASQARVLASSRSGLPVDITAVTPGPPAAGAPREIVSLDISEYGDPIHTRTIRMPFTRYRKPWRTGMADQLQDGCTIPPMFCVPLHEMDVFQALEMRRDESEVASLAMRASTEIPEESTGMARLVAEYLASPLRRFHDWFYLVDQHPEDRWPETYHLALAPLHPAPPCTRHVLNYPNDLLLKPAGIQLVVRSFVALGWHPRHISGLIRARFCDPAAGWGDTWEHYDPGIRAEFYTRLFAGQLATGLDGLLDFNCTSTQEKGFCFNAGGGCNLGPFHDKIPENLPTL